MSIFKSIIIAFSMYSRIPMPMFTWNEKDMEHVITFLPLVGAVIGGICYAAVRLSILFELPCMVITLILTLVPIFVTGGFHLDGFMDVQDAIKSYQSKEKKLEIMKDPHIGAFAIISLVGLGLIWICSLYYVVYKALQTGCYKTVYIYAIVFAFVRGICGITCVKIQNAKKDSMLNMESGRAGNGDFIFLIFESLAAILLMGFIKTIAAPICTAVILLYTFYYKRFCDKTFGGITGDTSGYFVVTGECLLTVALAIFSIWS